MTACTICGPLEAPAVHSICHPVDGIRRGGCGHPLDEHTDTLVCQVCGIRCGVYCTGLEFAGGSRR